jgi:serine phosphatase RsbU (regulator of sigma subunit)
VLRSAGLASLESAAGGPPLCVLDEFEYGSDTVELARRDAVVMFTDGVTEAANAAGELYGRKRLEALLARVPREASADDLLREILADLRAFVGAAEPSDDVTLLVVRWLGPAQP